MLISCDLQNIVEISLSHFFDAHGSHDIFRPFLPKISCNIVWTLKKISLRGGQDHDSRVGIPALGALLRDGYSSTEAIFEPHMSTCQASHIACMIEIQTNAAFVFLGLRWVGC